MSPAADAPAIYVHAIGHQQVNDAWLVQVARHNRGRLVTFDNRLRAHAIDAGQVEVIES
jgi:predicted nucleic acid-binding protein